MGGAGRVLCARACACRAVWLAGVEGHPPEEVRRCRRPRWSRVWLATTATQANKEARAGMLAESSFGVLLPPEEEGKQEVGKGRQGEQGQKREKV